MRALRNPWQAPTAVLAGLVLALSMFAVSRAAITAPTSVPRSVPGGASVPGSPPVSSPSLFTIDIEIEQARIVGRGTSAEVTLTYICPPRAWRGQPVPPPRDVALNVFVRASQPYGRENLRAADATALTCKGDLKQSVTLSPDYFDSPPYGQPPNPDKRFRAGRPILVTAYSSTDAYPWGYREPDYPDRAADTEALILKKR